MAASLIVDAGFLIALLHRRDTHHAWAAVQANERPPPWTTCEAVLSEAFHLLGDGGRPSLSALLRRQMLLAGFSLAENAGPVLTLMEKYRQMPMSFSDACLVRMTEVLPDPLLLTTDSDIRVYRRNGRQTIPCILPE